MDSTLPAPTSNPSPSIKSSSSSYKFKLPVKRKNDDLISSNPNHQNAADDEEDDDEEEEDGDGAYVRIASGDRNKAPFKFHRIWTEPDEIRFLNGLLDCASDGLSFPRDLHIFYSRFSGTMSKPYSKSQLSEKLRRLRKKFRVISSRLERGLDKSLLSPHDRALYDLSKQLWDPGFGSRSPFVCGNNSSNSKKSKNNLIGIKVSFSPSLPSISTTSMPNNQEQHDDAKLREVNVEFMGSFDGGDLGMIAAKTVINVFDQSLKEVRMTLVGSSSSSSKEDEFERRWREQRVAELDVWARRIRLVLEQSLVKQ
ncbi:probable transcription factor At5g28040 [Impatiens glandulifera]|uniref:probable transcription factor At5g28040 n=1 Tax=Impatiens glandulifera TaxID=253017 RepID=UPI001FB15505|nr:probable transcription factor At5g28040 [Impatiens glandulifera]